MHSNVVTRLFFACAWSVGLGAACTTTQGSPVFVVPAAAAPGQVLVRDGRNGNTELIVDVNDLPPPSDYGAGARAYVVWLRPIDVLGMDDYFNIGPVRVDDAEHGRLATLTPHDAFDVLVTAEERPNASEPSGAIVLRSRVSR